MNITDNFTPELLAPAGSFEKLVTALLYGANAVYLGGETFNLRDSCDGFSENEVAEAVKLANQKNAKIFYTLNALPMEKDMQAMPAVIEAAAKAGVHAFIIADPGVLRLAKRYAPQVEIHLSTQANTTNAESIAFWHDLGVCRVNLARELSSRDIYAIRKNSPDVELEVFIHGAMCLAVSGQCLLSAWLNKRPANLGRCTHPCRFEYRPLNTGGAPTGCSACHSPDTSLTVAEKTRPDTALWTVTQGEKYSSFWAPQDLCLMPYLPWFVKNRIDSLKIEGRMKGASYVAHVVDAYRYALDIAAKQNNTAMLNNAPVQELLHTSSRPLASGFFVPADRLNFTEKYGQDFKPKALIGKIGQQLNHDTWEVDLRGTWAAGDNVCLLLPGMRRPVIAGQDYMLENTKGDAVSALHSGTKGILRGNFESLQTGIFVRQA